MAWRSAIAVSFRGSLHRGGVGLGLAVLLACPSSVPAYAIASASSPVFASPPARETLRDHWYVLTLDGKPCGRMHRAAWREGSSIRSREATEMAVSRDGTQVAIAIELEVVESLAGDPIRAERRFTSNGQTQTTVWRFEGDRVETIESQGGSERRSNVALPPREPKSPWLAPAQAEAFAESRRAAGADRLELRALTFDRGLEVRSTIAVREDASNFRWQGREIPAVRWEVLAEDEPSKSRQWWSTDGRLLESRTPTGLGELVATIATEAEASSWRRGELPDVVRATVVPLGGRLPPEGEATLRVSKRDGELPDLPSTAMQRFERIDAATARLVLLAEPRPDRLAEPPDDAMLAASALLELEDPVLRELAAKPPETSPDALAEALRRLVRRHLRNKDLGVAFASAAEAARSRQGDCSEHATLLCALLRIRGIPARIAVGLGHAERFGGQSNVFAWHAWTQAWIGDRWVDLDATVARPRDGRRIAVAFSDLSKGLFDPVWSETLPLMGAMAIEVERRDLPR
ncbi:MAG: transglutaminase-like domain-containing protein [Phycisphaerales bacterium]